MNQSHNNATPKIVGAVVISTVMMITLYILVLRKSDDVTTASNQTSSTIATTTDAATSTTSNTSTATPAQSATDTTATSQPTTTPATTTYKDGTYTSNISYRVPHGTNSLKTSITIKDGVITAVTTDSTYADHESEFYISDFESAVKGAVVGKKITSSFSSRIGGASLTGNAFLNAIDSVIAKAKA